MLFCLLSTKQQEQIGITVNLQWFGGALVDRFGYLFNSIYFWLPGRKICCIIIITSFFIRLDLKLVHAGGFLASLSIFSCFARIIQYFLASTKCWPPKIKVLQNLMTYKKYWHQRISDCLPLNFSWTPTILMTPIILVTLKN